jgi:hypothetical protein
MSITTHVLLFAGTSTHDGVQQIQLYKRINGHFRECLQHLNLVDVMSWIPEGTRTIPVGRVVKMGETFEGTLFCIRGVWPCV